MNYNLLQLINDLRGPSTEKAWKALENLEVTLTPQGIAFEKDAPDCIPLMLALACTEDSVIAADLMQYLGEMYCSAIWTWRRVCNEAAPARRHIYNAYVAAEESIADSYDHAIPEVLALALRPGDTRLRGASVFLLGGAVDRRQVLVSELQELYSQVDEETLQIDIIESVANLGIGPRSDEWMRSAVTEWLRLRLHESAAGTRLGAALSLLARVKDDENESLRDIIVDSRYRGKSTVESAMWLSRKTIDWALDRRLTKHLP